MDTFKRALVITVASVCLIGTGAGTASGQNYEIIASQFGDLANVGRFPAAGLILASDGNFYGTTYEGGANGVGAIFRMTPAGVVTIIHSFDNTNGSHPYSELVEGTDGNLYGTTNDQATSNSGVGTVFTITKQGTGFTVLHALPATPVNGCFTEGAGIMAPLAQGVNGLYGVIASGGCDNPNAAVFRIAPSGANRFSIIGHIPDTGTTSGLVRGADGFLYGTTEGSAGLGFGVIYRIGESGGDGQILHVLTRAEGYAHTGEMIQASDGKFYGTARAGGEYVSPNPINFDGGTVFQFVPGPDAASSTYTRLYSFAENDPAGSEPYTGLVEGSDGLLYGTTIRTGATRTFVGADQGSIFSINPITLAVSSLHTFDPSGEGSPRGPLVEQSPGQFVGTTFHGGLSNFGAVFRLTLSTATTTSLSAAPTVTVFGQPMTLTASVTSSGNVIGNVQFFDGNSSLGTAAVSDGAATSNTAGLTVGGHTLFARYLGNSSFLPSTSANVPVTVNRAATTISLESSPNPSARKQVVTITATVAAVAPGAGTATGQVQFLDGKKKLGAAALVNGVATLQVAFNNMGGHDLTASYAGDANFTGAASSVVIHNVNK